MATKKKMISNNGKVRLNLKKNEWDEYEVEWVENGKRNEGKTNYTDDIDDAVGTMKMMMEHYEKYGN